MEALLIRYYNLNRFLLSLTGLWPFQNQIVRRIQSFFVHIILISSILVQIFKFFTSEPSVELFINVSTYMIVCLAYLSKYSMYLWQLQNIKYLLIRLCHNWDVLIDERELEIMEEHALKGKKFTLVCLALTCTLMIVLIIWTCSLMIYDVVAPLNGSHHVRPPFLAEYFVDEEVYFYYILTHMYTICLITVVIIISVETFYGMCVQHACGLFYIAGYRFERAFNESTLSLLPFSKRSFEISERIVRAIKAHKNAIEFVDHINSCFSTSYFLLLFLAVAALTVNSTDILQAIKAERVYDALNDFTRIFNITGYMFCASYCGQRLIDCSTSISEKAYNFPWFLAPLNIRGSLLVVMQRSLKKCTLTLGNLFPLSFEFFTMVLKVTSCYITTLRTLQ